MLDYYPPDICICTTSADLNYVRGLPAFIGEERLVTWHIHKNIVGVMSNYFVYFIPLGNLSNFTDAERKFIFNGEGIPV